MKVTQTDKIRSVYEQIFWQAVNDHNESETAANPSAPDIITTSQARALHDRAEAVVSEAQRNAGREAHGFSTAGIVSACGAIRDVMRERTGSDIFPEGPANQGMTGKDYYTNTQLYSDSMDAVLRAMDLQDDKSTLGPNGAYLVSPYDPRFANRSAVLANGSRMGAIQADQAESLSDAVSMVRGRDVMFSTVRRDKDGNFRYRETDSAMVSEDDISGIVRLRPYMTEQEYEQVRDWANRGMNVGDTSPAAVDRRTKALDRTIHILEGLRSEGRTYKIQRDSNPGQIKACIDGTRIEVRVTEREGMENYIGHVYDRNDGANYRFDTTARKDPSDAKKGPVVYEPTPEDSLQLVRYALGETVQRTDGRGPVGQATRETIRPLNGGGRNGAETNSTYVIDNRSTTVYGQYGRGYNGVNPVVVIRREMGNPNTSAMPTADAANEYLVSAIESARENYAAELNVEGLIADWTEHHEEDDWEPTYSGDQAIATTQAAYIDVLEGRRVSLLRPGVDEDEFLDELETVGEYETDSVVEAGVSMSKLRSKMLTLDDVTTPEDLIRQHAAGSLEENIGAYEPGPDGTRFNPVGVAQFQNSGYSSFRNTDDIVQAMRILGMTKDDVRGDNYYCNTVRDKLVRFDFNTSVPMSEKQSPFMQSMYETVRSSLEQNGVAFDGQGDGIRIDDNGIVHWAGSIAKTMGTRNGRVQVTGEIGQIFEPDARGVVRTAFNGSENYACVPGYEATIAPQKAGEHLSINERTRVRGYEQSMREAIAYQVRRDVAGFAVASSRGGMLGSPASLNNTYRHLYDERYDLDFEETYERAGMDPTLLDAVIRTQAGRVRYPNEIRDGSTTYMQYQMQNGMLDIANDNNTNAASLTGGHNMAIMSKEIDGGYYDLLATTSTSTSQGTVVFLTEGAQVTPDGRIIPSDDKEDKCALMAHPTMRFSEFDQYDRIWMTVSNIMQAKTVRAANVAQVDCAGWDMEDGMPISKEWAEANPHDVLVKGDKIADLHGNKGVTPIIIDRNMSEDEARAQGIYEPWAFFRANPELDIVMSPLSGVSRYNGGTFREANANGAMDLRRADGTVIPGAMGRLNIIITDKSAEAKTHAYDQDDLAAGRGRKASPQLSWAMSSKGADVVMDAYYGSNMAPVTNLREYLITCGMDMDEQATIHRGYQPHEGEERKVFHTPELVYSETKSGGTRLNEREMRKVFQEMMGRQGGVMEIPFELDYPNGDKMPPMNDGHTDVVYTAEEWERKGYTRKDGTYVRPTTVRRHVDANTARANNQPLTWGMPVLSSYLRSGQSFADGTTSTHDFTHRYENIFVSACKYRDIQNRLGEMTASEAEDAERRMRQLQNSAQSEYNAITGEIISRQFEGKHNIFRDGIMSHRMPHSATAVWTADPRLGTDEVAMGKALAETLNVRDGDVIQVWRDPILDDVGTAMKTVKIDDSLTGCAVTPVAAKPMGGDFDGDTVANVNLPKYARAQAMELFGMQNTMLDESSVKPDGTRSLSMNTGGNVQIARHFDPQLDADFKEFTADLNKAMAADATVPWSEVDPLIKQGYVERQNELYRRSFDRPCASVAIRYDSAEAHLQSMAEACLETGAKGSWDKLRGYAKQAGVTIQDDGVGPIKDYGSASLTEHSGMEFSDQQAVMYATSVKSFATGVGGGYSQRGIAALRNYCPTAVLKGTEPVTQSILNSKRSREEAVTKYDLTQGPLRSLWKGRMMTQDEDGKWLGKYNEDGRAVQATRDEWVTTMHHMYNGSTAENCLNVHVSRQYIEQIADAMVGDNGEMQGVDDPDFLATHAAPLDRMAYGGGFKAVCEMAGANDGKGTFLFEGKNNEAFMPRAVRKNREIDAVSQQLDGIVAEDEMPKKRAFVKSDTLEDSKAVIKGPRKTIDVGAILANAEKASSKGDLGDN